MTLTRLGLALLLALGPQPSAVSQTAQITLRGPGADGRGPIQTWWQSHEAEILAELRALLAIPNVASDRENIGRNAEAIRTMFERRGVTTRLLTAAGAPPAVYGELRVPGARRTVMFYAHYDGQPVDPSKWTGDPWTPVLRTRALDEGGREVPFPKPGERVDPEMRIYARSASDDKGPIVAMAAALDALRASGVTPSSNLKFFFEGEEEASSPHLRDVLTRNRDLLAADVWFLCDGPVHQTRAMQVYFGVRGVMGLEMTTYGPRRALHSGHYGNWAPNPIVTLAGIIAGMRATDGTILIENFDRDVRPLSDAERRALARIPAVEPQLKGELALAAAESEESLPSRITRPGINLRGIQSGGVGEHATNAIPTSATASIDFRMVPDQTPAGVRELVEAHLRRRGFHVVHDEPSLEVRRKHERLVRLEWESGYPAARTPLDHPVSRFVLAAVERATGSPPVALPTLGGSVPMYLFQEVLQTPVIGVPIVNHDNNQHAANENLRLQNLWDGIEIFAALMTEK